VYRNAECSPIRVVGQAASNVENMDLHKAVQID